MLTTRLVAHISTYLHLSRKSDNCNAYSVADASIKGVMYVPRIVGGERAKDDNYLSRRMRGQMASLGSSEHIVRNKGHHIPHTSPSHLDCILQTWLPCWLESMPIFNGLQHVRGIAFNAINIDKSYSKSG